MNKFIPMIILIYSNSVFGKSITQSVGEFILKVDGKSIEKLNNKIAVLKNSISNCSSDLVSSQKKMDEMMSGCEFTDVYRMTSTERELPLTLKQIWDLGCSGAIELRTTSRNREDKISSSIIYESEILSEKTHPNSDGTILKTFTVPEAFKGIHHISAYPFGGTFPKHISKIIIGKIQSAQIKIETPNSKIHYQFEYNLIPDKDSLNLVFSANGLNKYNQKSMEEKYTINCSVPYYTSVSIKPIQSIYTEPERSLIFKIGNFLMNQNGISYREAEKENFVLEETFSACNSNLETLDSHLLNIPNYKKDCAAIMKSRENLPHAGIGITILDILRDGCKGKIEFNGMDSGFKNFTGDVEVKGTSSLIVTKLETAQDMYNVNLNIDLNQAYSPFSYGSITLNKKYVNEHYADIISYSVIENTNKSLRVSLNKENKGGNRGYSFNLECDANTLDHFNSKKNKVLDAKEKISNKLFNQ